jgi:hypothetical protein
MDGWTSGLVLSGHIPVICIRLWVVRWVYGGVTLLWWWARGIVLFEAMNVLLQLIKVT